jgi:hypothetical protein
MKYSAVIVTRGDVALGPVIDAIDADEIIIRRGHSGVWERYQAALTARNEIVYTQDDDCVVDVAAVLAAFESPLVTCNMPMDRRPEYQDGIALVGWGSVFHQRAVEGLFSWDRDDLFRRECDRVFTAMNRVKLIDVPFQHLPWAHGADRMGREERHGRDLAEIRRRIAAVKRG